MNYFHYGLSVAKFSLSLNTVMPWYASHEGPHKELPNPLFSVTTLRSSWNSWSKSPAVIAQSCVFGCPGRWPVLSPSCPQHCPLTTTNGWVSTCSHGALLCAPPGWLWVQAPWKSMKCMLFSPPFYRKGNGGTESLSNLCKRLPPEPNNASALNQYTAVDFSFSSRPPIFGVL